MMMMIHTQKTYFKYVANKADEMKNKQTTKLQQIVAASAADAASLHFTYMR